MSKLTLAKIQNGGGPDNKWRPDVFHRVHPSQGVGEKKHWWYQGVEGIQILGEDRPPRTRGKPRTLTRVATNFGAHIEEAVENVEEGVLIIYEDVDDERASRELEFRRLMAAVFATENGGRIEGDRYEKRINDWSFGPAQFLTSTAHAVACNLGLVDGLPAKTMKQDGSDTNKKAWKAYLEDPFNAAHLMASFLYELNRRFDLRGDPVLLYAAYNAGSPRPSRYTKFGLVYYDPDRSGPKPGAVDHFVAWYGDACAVLG